MHPARQLANLAAGAYARSRRCKMGNNNIGLWCVQVGRVMGGSLRARRMAVSSSKWNRKLAWAPSGAMFGLTDSEESGFLSLALNTPGLAELG